ncbi:cell division protein SepF [Pyrococcus yayanosii]|uniref:Cell division protein SepF n=1 Tax=Pyrococcus yayanosii (strain CH1 / JCM 16557) TaxID=529709 RepID=F8AFU2_PYRYC|nr:cell division protein SepF [Pyrococcus yayanosii]AEH23843.1 hypothetical protein PYCH_01340 [Pyrococcus yayanosii CH1]
MGLFDKLKKGEAQRKPVASIRKDVKGKTPDVELVPLEEDAIARELVKPQTRYIKKIVVTSYADLEKISSELQAGNIVIADLTPLESKTEILAKVAEQIKGMAQALGGDVAKISKCEIKLIITPSDIKISRE